MDCDAVPYLQGDVAYCLATVRERIERSAGQGDAPGASVSVTSSGVNAFSSRIGELEMLERNGESYQMGALGYHFSLTQEDATDKTINEQGTKYPNNSYVENDSKTIPDSLGAKT